MDPITSYLISLFGPLLGRLLFTALFRDQIDFTTEQLTEILGDNINLEKLLKLITGNDRVSKRSAANFEYLGEELAESLSNLIKRDREKLTKDEIEDVLTVAQKIINTKALPLLIASDFDETKFRHAITRETPRSTSLWGNDKKALLGRLLDQAIVPIFQAVKKLPDFTAEVTIEILKKERLLLEGVQEVLTELSGIWADTFGQRQDARSASFESDYRRVLSHHLNQMSFFGVSLLQGAHQPLNIAFVKLKLDQVTKEADEDQLDPRHFRKEREPLSPEEAFALDNRLLIVADAGYGKTTLLKWAALQAAQRQNEALHTLWGTRIPFFIRLRDYANKPLPTLNQLVGSYPDIAYLQEQAPDQWALDQFRNDNAILFLDGLDEVGQAKREEAIRWLKEQLFLLYKNTPVIVTTRPSPLNDQAQHQWLHHLRFKPLSLQQMNPKQITDFISQWHTAMGADDCEYRNKSKLPSKEKQLTDALEKRDDLQKLARTPLLCGMLCTLNLERLEELPQERAQLYKQCIDLLLARDDARKVDVPSEYQTNYRPETILRWLGRLAFWMMQHEQSTISRADAEAIVRREQIEAPLFVRFLSERTAILRQQALDEFDFVHRTFQEYLAARHIVTNHDHKAVVKQYVRQPEWEQTIVFLGIDVPERDQAALLEAMFRPDAWRKTDEQKKRRHHEMAWRFWQLLDTPTTAANRWMQDHAEGLVKLPSKKQTHISHPNELKWLIIDHPEIYQLKPINHILTLKYLGLDNTAVSDLTPLSQMLNLQGVGLDNTAVSDLIALSKLLNLEYLGLSGTAVSDLAPLSNLPNLQYLFLTNTTVSDLEPLSKLLNLEYLFLSGTAVSDLAPLSNLLNLQELFLYNTAVSDLSPLSNLLNLQHLDLDNTAVSDLAPLSNLLNLQELYLDNTAVSDLVPLSNLLNLQELYLDNTAVSDTSPLDHLIAKGLIIYGP